MKVSQFQEVGFETPFLGWEMAISYSERNVDWVALLKPSLTNINVHPYMQAFHSGSEYKPYHLKPLSVGCSVMISNIILIDKVF